MKTRTNFKYGVKVIASIALEDIRAKECLCLNCQRLVTEEDVEGVLDIIGGEEFSTRLFEIKRAFNCPTAQANYELCVAGGVAAPISRCPFYLPKAE